MAAQTDERPDLLTVIAYVRAAPGKRDDLRQALEALIEPTSREKGYVTYDLHQSAEDPDMFLFYENGESGADLDAHLTAPHLVDVAARTPELLDEQGLTVDRVRRIG